MLVDLGLLRGDRFRVDFDARVASVGERELVRHDAERLVNRLIELGKPFVITHDVEATLRGYDRLRRLAETAQRFSGSTPSGRSATPASASAAP